MSLKVLSIGVLVGSVALLSGCALNSVHLNHNSSLRNRSFVKSTFYGHAFKLGTVTVANSQGKPAADHPLPTSAYMELIRFDLQQAFTNAHLGEGVKPAYVVNIQVTRLHFISDNGFGLPSDLTHVTSVISFARHSEGVIGAIAIHPYDAGGYFYGYWHAPRWDYCRRTIPLTAIYVAKAIERLRDGKPIHDDDLGTDGATIFQHIDDKDLGEYCIKSLRKKEIEDITGYSRQQLHDFDKPW